MSDKFEMSTGQAHELAMALERNGWTKADVKKMSEGNALMGLLAVIRGWSEVTPKQFPSSAVAAPFIAEFEAEKGMKLQIIEDQDSADFQVKSLEPSFPVGNNEHEVGVRTIRERAKYLKANCTAADATRMLDNQAEIPLVFLPTGLILFTGTVFQDMVSGERYIMYLAFNDIKGSWKVGFLLMHSGDYSQVRFCLPHYNKK